MAVSAEPSRAAEVRSPASSRAGGPAEEGAGRGLAQEEGGQGGQAQGGEEVGAVEAGADEGAGQQQQAGEHAAGEPEAEDGEQHGGSPAAVDEGHQLRPGGL